MWPRHGSVWIAPLAIPLASSGMAARLEPPRSADGQPARIVAATLDGGAVSFDGHATTGGFVGTTRQVTGAVFAGADYESPLGWVEVALGTLRTGNGLRDRDLRKVMEVERYPTMRYELTGATARSAASADRVHLLLHGVLRLHGVSRSLDVPVSVARSGDSAHVTGTFPLHVTDYDIDGLRRMGGLLRMRDGVEVHLALRFVMDRTHTHDPAARRPPRHGSGDQ